MSRLPILAILLLVSCHYVESCKAIPPVTDINPALRERVEKGGWTYLPKTQKIYQVFIEEITQPEAKRRCQEKGGQLATIHSKEENDLLYSLSKDPSVTTATYRAYIWIGLEKIDGKFQWLDGSPVDYTNWGPGEPNNYRGEESCTQFSQLTLSYGSMDPRGWNDYYCFEEIRGYACEKNVQP
ncbi:hypothetical protein Q1695_006644 [Nippostrongylus brasiliensis]|nr:hypothetical protein Q1695_006644 [Nippostrongylus brasiliensis]